jgi:DMSO/TMAO reductase YedYZ molybdopterin-dependent catalytic subunit
MADVDAKIFKLLETADNFVKYARPGGRDRALERARKRYLKAAELAEAGGDAESLERIKLRMADLDRLSRQPEDAQQSDEDERSDEDGRFDEEGSDYRGIVDRTPTNEAGRVPPGQRVTRRWPVLHEGAIPRFDPSSWHLTIKGAVGREVTLGYDELKALGTVQMRSDFHCVTGWSKLDNVWEGIRARDVLKLAEPQADAMFVSVGAEYGYTANVPLAVLLEESSLLAWGHNGEPLAPKHGFPLRLVVPRLYGWKSVKWVRSFDVLTRDRRGYWELRGYHNQADPWLEQRYSYQE